MKITICMEIESPRSSYEDIKRLEQHIDEFVDTEAWPDITIQAVKVSESEP